MVISTMDEKDLESGVKPELNAPLIGGSKDVDYKCNCTLQCCWDEFK